MITIYAILGTLGYIGLVFLMCTFVGRIIHKGQHDEHADTDMAGYMRDELGLGK